MERESGASGSRPFGVLLRHHRLAAGLSQEALAERARMSSAGISALERGHRRTPQRETLALLANALELDVDRRLQFETAARASAQRGPANPDDGEPASADNEPAPLPLPLTTFVGRDRELEEVMELLRQGRLLTRTGAGGIGKTQVALHAGSALCRETDCAVRFVDLAAVGASRVTSSVATA